LKFTINGAITRFVDFARLAPVDETNRAISSRQTRCRNGDCSGLFTGVFVARVPLHKDCVEKTKQNKHNIKKNTQKTAVSVTSCCREIVRHSNQPKNIVDCCFYLVEM
jgi:hypothetical protein